MHVSIRASGGCGAKDCTCTSDWRGVTLRDCETSRGTPEIAEAYRSFDLGEEWKKSMTTLSTTVPSAVISQSAARCNGLPANSHHDKISAGHSGLDAAFR